MAVWNAGPFDNDEAVEWCARLEATAPAERARVIRETLEKLTRAPADPGFDTAAAAVAAAATVVQCLIKAQPSGSPYAPRFLLDVGDLEITPDLRTLAAKALGTVLRKRSKWRQNWDDDVEGEEAIDSVRALRDALIDRTGGQLGP